MDAGKYREWIVKTFLHYLLNGGSSITYRCYHKHVQRLSKLTGYDPAQIDADLHEDAYYDRRNW